MPLFKIGVQRDDIPSFMGSVKLTAAGNPGAVFMSGIYPLGMGLRRSGHEVDEFTQKRCLSLWK